jgi:hypothetical protein
LKYKTENEKKTLKYKTENEKKKYTEIQDRK